MFYITGSVVQDQHNQINRLGTEWGRPMAKDTDRCGEVACLA
jgi:hypothetical protein